MAFSRALKSQFGDIWASAGETLHATRSSKAPAVLLWDILVRENVTDGKPQRSCKQDKRSQGKLKLKCAVYWRLFPWFARRYSVYEMSRRSPTAARVRRSFSSGASSEPSPGSS